MTPEELLKPRMKCIGTGIYHYPNSPYKIGEILTENENGSFENDNHYSFPNDILNYRHLFKPLQWWEERRPEDMPEYVKDATGKIWKVKNWTNGTMQIETGNAWRIVPNVMCFYEPATEAEYLTSKSK